MKHILESQTLVQSFISIEEKENYIEINIRNFENSESTVLNKKELHSFIGQLLHIQSKMKGGQNG